MKVFVSWSGDLSNRVAISLKDFIESCIQTVTVFVSSEDIEKGQRWNEILTNELEKSNFGIVCLTEENIAAPWIYFEAGALSKHLSSKVSALVINTSISNIQGPLKTFQATLFEEKNLYDLLQSINNSSQSPISEKIIKKSFDAFWSEFSNAIKKHIAETKEKGSSEIKPKFDTQSTLEEILLIVRNMSNTNQPSSYLYNPYIPVKIKSNRSKTINFLFDLANGHCDLCGQKKSTLEMHHIISVIEGGIDDLENIIIVCKECNRILNGDNVDNQKILSLKYLALQRKIKIISNDLVY